MSYIKKKEDRLLNVYFLKDTFVVEGINNSIDDVIEKWIKAFEVDKYETLYKLGFVKKEIWFSPSLIYLHDIAEILIKKLIREIDIEFKRENVIIELSENELIELKEEIPFLVGMEFVDDEWLKNLWNNLLNVFKREIKDFDGVVARYFIEKSSNINMPGKVFFHLVENKEKDFPFAFMATYSSKSGSHKKTIHTPLKKALEEFEWDNKKLITLISTVIKVAESSKFISELLESGELFYPIKLTSEEAYKFLKEVEIYESEGIICRVPNWWKKKSNSVKMSIVVGENSPSKVGFDGIMDFMPVLKVGDEEISESEIRKFLEMAESLVMYKGKWIEVDKEKLKSLLLVFEKAKDLSNNEVISFAQAMKMELNINHVIDISSEDLDISVSSGKWLKNIRKKLESPVAVNVKIVSSFKAKLRKYQEIGYSWLNQMTDLELGACLADDMGLGKTVQIIAFLEYQRIEKGGKALLILPTSLIGNWEKEIEKFAPELPYQILHKSIAKNSDGMKINEDKFLYITTYKMVSKIEDLKTRKWNYMILDEAQAIKNPGTKQTKEIKSIKAKVRIAMTGTPIENRLGDLWSLFDFLNPGLLGSPKEFSDFANGLKDDLKGYAKLRKIISPFILRRLKTDKSIISDLPEKIEVKAYTSLSKKQIALYKELIKKIEDSLEDKEGIDRKGIVLSSIMKFKQICNHPDHYLGKEDYKIQDSGKFDKLREICESIYEKREKVIIFTQFKEMTDPLSEFLESIFSRKGFVLHGSTPVEKRTKMVEEFNSEHYIPYMVLSLKAGGVGLNLTSANHVIHFDRWWNPAVENQATDRAFRIGQKKNVVVHKFITKGTIEEKIDEIIEDKIKLSGDVLSLDSEKWITEYSNEELMNMFALDGEL